MATATFHAESLTAFLRRLESAFDLDRNNLGEDALDRIAESAYDRFHAQRRPDGSPFARNRGRYGAEKRARGIPVGIGLVRGGDMGRERNFRGVREIGPREAEVGFGVEEFDARKGCWFTNGSVPGADGTERSGASGQPARPFFEATAADEAAIARMVEDAFDRWLGSEGG